MAQVYQLTIELSLSATSQSGVRSTVTIGQAPGQILLTRLALFSLLVGKYKRCSPVVPGGGLGSLLI
jgi:hypothetical protein